MAHSKMAPKRKVNVRGQKHSLAYINDREKRMLRQAGGSGKPGPNGIPTYFDVGEGMGGYDSGSPGSADTAGGRGDPDGGRDDGGTYADTPNAISTSVLNTQYDKAKAYKPPEREPGIKGYFSYNTPKVMLESVNAMAGKFTMPRMIEALKDRSNRPVYGANERVTGVADKFGNLIEGTDPLNSLGLMDESDGGNNNNIRSGAKKKVTAANSVDGKLPDAPKSGEGGDATDDAKRRSKMGKESTISTTSQGLLTDAKKRDRSLMSGLIS